MKTKQVNLTISLYDLVDKAEQTNNKGLISASIAASLKEVLTTEQINYLIEHLKK